MLKVLPDMLSVRYVFYYCYFGLACFLTQNFRHDCDFTFILFLYYICDHSVRIISRLFDRLPMQIDNWFLCDLDALIEVYSSYLIYVLFIYLFVLYYLCFCLLILLILRFVVTAVDVAYSSF